MKVAHCFYCSTADSVIAQMTLTAVTVSETLLGQMLENLSSRLRALLEN